MGKQNVSSLVVRETEDGLKADVECVRRPPNSIAFLRLLSHLFKVRPIRFPPMVLFIGHSSAIRLLRSLEDFEGIRAARAMPSLKDVPSLPKSFRESSPLQRSLVRWRLLSRWEKQEVNPSSSTTIFGNFPIGHLASFSLKAGFI